MRKSIEEISYNKTLDLFETQLAIKFVKDTFQKELIKQLNLVRVTAPMFVVGKTGLNDNLSGVETPVNFNVKNIDGNVEIVHSLAKWKRMALGKYNFKTDTGLYTDMNAIRKDEDLDFYHSIYVDQWDWEKVITSNDRNITYLKKTVSKIYKAIYKLQEKVTAKYPILTNKLPKNIHFISTTELENMYPNLSSKEREDAICRKYKAVFLYQIGYKLPSGNPHDSRSADYDDWDLNGDIIVYYPVLDIALELSSMGVRVDEESLKRQLDLAGCPERAELEFQKALLNHELPYTIGGGLGQSRICMFFLRKAHIGEVQSSTWPEHIVKAAYENGIQLL